jgi:hypothetical protein
MTQKHRKAGKKQKQKQKENEKYENKISEWPADDSVKIHYACYQLRCNKILINQERFNN